MRTMVDQKPSGDTQAKIKKVHKTVATNIRLCADLKSEEDALLAMPLSVQDLESIEHPAEPDQHADSDGPTTDEDSGEDQDLDNEFNRVVA